MRPTEALALLGVAFWILSAGTASHAQTSRIPGTQPDPGVAAPSTEPIPPVGVIVSGRVRDARSGRAVRSAEVFLDSMVRPSGALPAGYSAASDAKGRFEFHSVSPGTYLVAGSAPGYVRGGVLPWKPTLVNVTRTDVSGLDVVLEPTTVVSGRIFDAQGDGLEGVEVEVLREGYQRPGPTLRPNGFAQSDEHGFFRVVDLAPGRYIARAMHRVSTRRSRDEGATVYSPTYFPHTTHLEEAFPFSVAGGGVTGLDIAMVAVEAVDVAGQVINGADVALVGAEVYMYRPGVRRTSPYRARIRADGSFDLGTVIPGDYVFTIMRDARALAGERVSISEAVEDMAVVIPPRVTLEGRIVNAGSRELSLGTSGAVRVAALSRFVDGQAFLTGGEAVARANGQFSVPDVAGLGTLRVSGLPERWVVSAVRKSTLDVTDTLTDFAHRPGIPFEIEVTDRPAGMAGRVLDDDREPRDYTVVVFPADRDRWGPQSQSVRAHWQSSDRRFRVDALPSGDYLAAAVSGAPANAWHDPVVLETLRSRAVPFRLNGARQHALTLRVSPFPAGLRPPKRR